MRRKPRAPRPKPAIGSRSSSRAPSTARRSRAAPARTSRFTIGSNTFIPGFEEQLIGDRRRRNPDPEGLLPEELCEREARRPARRVRDHGDPDRGAAGRPDRRRVRQDARPGIARQAEGSRARAAGGGIRRRDPPAGQAPAARPSRRNPSLRGAAVAGRGGIQPDVEFDQGRDGIRAARRSPTRTPPKRPPRRSTARSPTAGSASGSCCPRSARGTRSR